MPDPGSRPPPSPSLPPSPFPTFWLGSDVTAMSEISCMTANEHSLSVKKGLGTVEGWEDAIVNRKRGVGKPLGDSVATVDA